MSGSRPLRIGVSGARGRVGRAIAAAIGAREDLVLSAAIGRPESAGAPFEGVVLSGAEQALGLCDVIVDVSNPQAAAALARLAARRGGPALVIGATGFSQTDEAAVREAAARIAVVK